MQRETIYLCDMNKKGCGNMKRYLAWILVLLLLITAMPMAGTAGAEETGQGVFILPAAIREVQEQAFAGNANLKMIVIPNTITSIGKEAFKSCTALSEVTIAGRDVTISDDAFLNCSPDMVFYAHDDSNVALWAMAHGYRCESLDEGTDNFARFEALLAHGGFDAEILLSGTYASKCLIVRTQVDHLPDISAYHPIDIYRSDEHLYYVQFEDEETTEACYTMLDTLEGVYVEPDRVGEGDSVSAQSVNIASYWGTNDTMGFDVYAPFVAAQNPSRRVTIAVIDSGVNQSVWNGAITDARSVVGGSALTSSNPHGSKVASIINDCIGENTDYVSLMPIKIETSSSKYRTTVIIEAIKHAANHGADIINLSWGWDENTPTSPEVSRQIGFAQNKGIIVVAAAGNGSGNVMFPANCDGVLSVSALTYSEATGYSVKSRTGGISYTAPGTYLSTGSYQPVDAAGDKLGVASTSFAAPQITAALALIKLDKNIASGNAISMLNNCCLKPSEMNLGSSECGNGLPQLDRLAVIKTTDIILENADDISIPTRLFLGEHDNEFLLTWTIVPSDATQKKVTVSSSEPSIVSCKQFGNASALISAKAIGDATITVTNGEVSKQFDLHVEQPVTQIIITGSDGNLITGENVQLSAVVLPADATNQNVAWESTNEQVASVENGLVSAKCEGTATIICRSLDGYGTSAQLNVQVVDVPPAESITLTAEGKEIVDDSVTLEKGELLKLNAQILPAEALQEVIYNVYPSSILSITDNGVVKAEKTGTATIVATASTGKNVTAFLTVNVVINPVSIVVSAEKSVLDIGEITTVTAELQPADATETAVTWTSGNTSVARVNKTSGVVTAVSSGTAVITGTTRNGKQASVEITVRKPITITFDANGGNCTVKERGAYSGYAIGNLPTAERENYAFAGWYTERNGGVRASEDSAYTADTTLYAHWEGLPFTIIFDANGGECETESRTAKVGAELGALPTPTKAYYTFRGWYTDAQFGDEVTAEYTHPNTDDLRLYAHWTANSYTMTFDKNGGACDTAVRLGVVDSPIGDLPVATRDYYIFDGWFTEADGGDEITEDYVRNTDLPIRVYAHWTPMTYIMEFDANGGVCEVSNKTYFVDTDIGELPVPTRDGYNFSGWYIEAETPAIHVTPTYQQANTNTVMVTARWTAMPYVVMFKPNGGSCKEESRLAHVDTPLGDLPVPTRDYYTFIGWFTAAEGGERVDATYQKSTTQPLFLYAHWEPMTYCITFDPNSGTCAETSRNGLVGEAIGKLPVPEKAYYSFDGWYTAESGGTLITEKYKQDVNDDLTLYAHWTPGTYTITLDANGGSCETAAITGTVDASIGTLPKPTKDYCIFKGWFKENGEAVSDGYVQSTTESFTLTARWEWMTYTMEFNANGGIMTSDVSRINTFQVNTPCGELLVATREYYTFDGWYTAATGGTQVKAGYKHPNTSTIMLYAHWTRNTCTITFNANGGSCSTASKPMNCGDAIGTLPTPTRTHYSFDGWYTAASGGNRISTSTVFTSATTLYAHWTVNQYTYTIRYVSSNGTVLKAEETMKKAYGSKATITPPTFAGYNTPSAQTVSWDTASKTVTFTYSPSSVAYSSFSGYRSESSPKEGYSAEIQYQNRTANSVQIRVVWSETLYGMGSTYNAYQGRFSGDCNGVKIPDTVVVPLNKWASAAGAGVNRTETQASSWITVPLTTTGSTSVRVHVEYYLYNANGTQMYPTAYRVYETWSVAIPAY